MPHYKKLRIGNRVVDEHRFLEEQRIGRRLSFNEVVHHKDEDKSNNAPENRQVMTRSEHSSLHAKDRVYGEDFSIKMRAIGIATMSNCKLTCEEVLQIKQLLDLGVGQSKIARSFNVAKNTICDIKNKRTWTHIQAA